MDKEKKEDSRGVEGISPAEILYLHGEIPSPQDMFTYLLEQWRGRIGQEYEIVPSLHVSPFSPGVEKVLALSQKTDPFDHWRTLIAEIVAKGAVYEK